ncbi:hypothetical protein SSX86_025645 [Deinandra increscens subsp. villosa]|uniref:TF-B3 domain-containing protein n=1 Tax=Deinandra increscens subsp. villosa TaxID=3103831 RepID=A0AAP0CDE4_9ASTR
MVYRDNNWVWEKAKDGIYTTATMRSLLSGVVGPVRPPQCVSNNIAWPKLVPLKANILMWRACLGRLPTRDGLARRGIYIPSLICPLCEEADESSEHLFSGCRVALDIWSLLSHWCKVANFFTFSTADLSQFFKRTNCCEKTAMLIQSIIHTACWVIWRTRNDVIFRNKKFCSAKVFWEIKSLSFLWISSRLKDYKKLVPMAKACEECTQSCIMMHKRNKNPSSLVTTFFKVMMGEDYSKILLLPPKFARGCKKLVDKPTHLEDYNGEKWNVKFTKINDNMAFQEGWNTFALAHRLQKGDLLVFHYIKKSHFVVLMYGSTGCPENRHFGFPHHPVKETEKNSNNLNLNGQSPSGVLTNCNNFSHESSSKSEPLVHGVDSMKTINKELSVYKMSPNENTTDKEIDPRPEPLVKNTDEETDQRSEPLVINTDKETDQRPEPLAKNTDKETDQRPEPLAKNTDKETELISEPLVKNTDKETDQRSEMLVKNTIPDYMVSKTPTTVKALCLVDNGNGHEKDECRRKSLQPVVVESNGGQKNNVAAPVAAGGGLEETEKDRIRRTVEAKLEKAAEKRKESTMINNEVAHSNSTLKRSRPDNVPMTPAKFVKKEPDTSVSRLHNSGSPFTPTGTSPKPMDKHMKPIKKEITTNHGLDGLIKKEPAMNHVSGGPIKKEPKPEPVDYDEAPLSGPSNSSFSAVMTSYQYLELPGWVKLKSEVILLRNGADLWAVLFQTKLGLKALTQNWETFAKEKGIKLGDKCEFVLESEPNSRFTCNVFGVHVTR